MPLKVVQIRFEDPPVPFDAGSKSFSYVAYPIDGKKRPQFASALCQWEHLYRLRMDRQWGFTPHLTRPQVFESLRGVDPSELHHGMELIRRRLTTAASMDIAALFIISIYNRKKKLRKVDDLKATVDNICQRIIEQGGRDAANNLSNFKTRERSPTRPVVHLAFALYLDVYHARMNKVGNRGKAIW
jgi:hypothetical protein